MTATLTQRYITATTKDLGAAVEEDVRAELEASIADAIDARLKQGDGRVDAERAVLTGLGDPALLGAGYTERPLRLIGPRYYLTWVRLLKVLLSTIPLIIIAAVVIIRSLANDSIGEVVAAAIAAGLSSVVYLSFWVTLVFAILDRAGTRTETPWTVDQLPRLHRNHVERSDMLASLVVLAAAAAAVVWDRLLGLARVGSEPVPVLNPDLWPWSITGVFILIAAGATLSVMTFVATRPATASAIANTVLNILSISLILTLIGRGELFNPAFVAVIDGAGWAAGGADMQQTLNLIAGFATVGFAGLSISAGWRRAARTTPAPR